jgi:hypothetical protein
MRTSLAMMLCCGAAACANDPVYIDPGSGPMPQMPIEGGLTDAMGNPIDARATLVLPIRHEKMTEMTDRAAAQAKLAMDPAHAGVEIPFIKLDDIEVSIEWKITNLDPMPGQARILLEGANQFFAYDSTMLVISNDEEAPPPPPLAGNIPIDIPASASVSGLFREDDLREAAIDLDQITRGNVNPFRATLTISKNATSFDQVTPLMLVPEDEEPPPQVSTGIVFPREAFPHMLRYDIVFLADRHMQLAYNIRVRDSRGVLTDKLLDADPADLEYPATFAPPLYTVAAAPP